MQSGRFQIGTIPFFGIQLRFVIWIWKSTFNMISNELLGVFIINESN